ncbi:MAG: polysaccharide deacetylase family protein [Clostridia bacterium]|nr:polysaccharide deacetylase family protein [Clostridia bacterium]
MRLKKIISAVLAFATVFSCFVLTSTAEESGNGVPSAKSTSVFAEITGAQGGARAIVSMTYDDGQYETAAWMNEMFAKYGLRASCMLIVSRHKSTQAKWQAIFDEGYLSPENHSMTHAVLPGTEWSKYEANKQNNTPENYQYELVDSKALLEELFGQPSVTFAASNNTLYTDAAEVVMDTYYAMRKGNRGSTSTVQSLDPIEGSDAKGGWYNPYMYGIDNSTLEVNKSYVQACIDKGGWFISMTHAVVNDSDDPTKPERYEAFYQFLAEKQAKNEIWVTTFAEATKYLRERQNSEVKAEALGDNISLEITMAEMTGDGLPLPESIFNVPLTVKVEVPSHWSAVSYDAGGETLYAKSFSDGGKRYVYVDALPNSKTELSSAEFAETVVLPQAAGTVTGDGEFLENELTVSGTFADAESLSFSYVSFDVPYYDLYTAKDAVLSLGILSGGGNVKVFGLTDGTVYGFEDAPGIIKGEGVDLSKVYGGAPLYTGSARGGALNASVYAYAESVSGSCTFLIVSDGDSGAASVSFDGAELKLLFPAKYDFSVITPKISMRLADNLEMCFYINAVDGIAGAFGNELSCAEDELADAERKLIDGSEYYAFPVAFAPLDIENEVVLNLKVKGSEGAVISRDYSCVPFDYIKTLLDDEAYGKSHGLLLDVLSYVRSAARCEDINVDTAEINKLFADRMYYEGANMATDQRVFTPDEAVISNASVSVIRGLEIILTVSENYRSDEYDVVFSTGGTEILAKKQENGEYVLRIPTHLASRKVLITVLLEGEEVACTAYNLKYSFYGESDAALKAAIARLENLSERALEYQITE